MTSQRRTIAALLTVAIALGLGPESLLASAIQPLHSEVPEQQRSASTSGTTPEPNAKSGPSSEQPDQKNDTKKRRRQPRMAKYALSPTKKALLFVAIACGAIIVVGVISAKSTR
jgi:hypothetical protein